MTDINQAIMHAKEPIDGRQGAAYIKVDGQRYLLFQLKNFSDDTTKSKTTINRLGTTIEGNRATSVKITWTATMWYNTDIFRDIMYKYLETGVDTYFDLQITNDDPNSDAGRHTVVYKDCNLDKVTMAKIDVDNNVLDEQISGTAERIEFPERFGILNGMRV